MKRRALISVSDKTGIVEFAKFLVSQDIEILSTGGTAKLLREENISVTDVSDFTGFPEIFDGRVKTLHPKIHGGILYVRDNKEHIKKAQDAKIEPIDIVVVNLYPFEETVLKEGVSEEEIIENIDIGGPSMIRSAAKNFQSVTVIIDPGDYEILQSEMTENNGSTTLETRRVLAAKAFMKTAGYDTAIAHFFTPDMGILSGQKIQDLRYGENPHQEASFYISSQPSAVSLAAADQLQGKALSFNNILDANAALSVVLEFPDTDPIATIVKHLTPCGTATADTIEEAYEKAYEADSTSAFGGIVAVNQEVTVELAKKLKKTFLEVIIAPSFALGALPIFAEKENLRLLQIGPYQPLQQEIDVRSVLGGFLVQDLDTKHLLKSDLKVVTRKKPTKAQIQDMLFAWKVCKHVKSNAIVLAKDSMTTGVGGGQTSRVDAAQIAVQKAKGKAKGSVCASDAFFPFPDALEYLAQSGISAILQPGGSKKDAEVIEACDRLGVAMVFTDVRGFLH